MVIVAHHEALADEFERVAKLQPEDSDTMNERAAMHRAEAARWRERIEAELKTVEGN